MECTNVIDDLLVVVCGTGWCCCCIAGKGRGGFLLT